MSKRELTITITEDCRFSVADDIVRVQMRNIAIRKGERRYFNSAMESCKDESKNPDFSL